MEKESAELSKDNSYLINLSDKAVIALYRAIQAALLDAIIDNQKEMEGMKDG